MFFMMQKNWLMTCLLLVKVKKYVKFVNLVNEKGYLFLLKMHGLLKSFSQFTLMCVNSKERLPSMSVVQKSTECKI